MLLARKNLISQHARKIVFFGRSLHRYYKYESIRIVRPVKGGSFLNNSTI
jgi:hypothetical protein